VFAHGLGDVKYRSCNVIHIFNYYQHCYQKPKTKLGGVLAHNVACETATHGTHERLLPTRSRALTFDYDVTLVMQG